MVSATQAAGLSALRIILSSIPRPMAPMAWARQTTGPLGRKSNCVPAGEMEARPIVALIHRVLWSGYIRNSEKRKLEAYATSRQKRVEFLTT